MTKPKSAQKPPFQKPRPAAAPKKETTKPVAAVETAPAPAADPVPPQPEPKKPEPPKVPGYVKQLVDNFANKVATLDDLVREVVETSVRGGSKPKDIAAAIEKVVEQTDKMGTYLARQLAQMHENSDKETNPMIRVTASNITRDLKSAIREIEMAPWAPSSYSKASDAMAKGRKSLDALVIVMGGAGIADVIVLPGVPLADEAGQPIVDPQTGEAPATQEGGAQ